MGAVSSQKGIERWDQPAKKRSNRARTRYLGLVSLAGAMEKEHPANPPGTRLHGESSHSAGSEGRVDLGWAIPFGFGPYTKSQPCGVEMRVYTELKEEAGSLPRQQG